MGDDLDVGRLRSFCTQSAHGIRSGRPSCRNIAGDESDAEQNGRCDDEVDRVSRRGVEQQAVHGEHQHDRSAEAEHRAAQGELRAIEQRVREFGVRIALGAMPSEITRGSVTDAVIA